MKLRLNNLFLLTRIIDNNIGSQAARASFSVRTSSHDATGSRASPAPLTDLLGRKHNYLRISLTEKCNLRCQYCMPAEGVQLSARSALLSTAEVLRLAGVFARLGVNKVRLTGGEPTLRPDLAEVIAGLRAIDGIDSVAITTNGLVLTRRLVALQRAGLSALNVSLDSLRAPRYERMARRPGLARVLAGIDLALQLGYSPVKVNTVLIRGFNDDEICDFVELTRDRDIEIRFIEFMPFSGNKWDDSKLVSGAEALAAARAAYGPLQREPPRPHDTATLWRAAGHRGRVGFISSMTEHFCAGCNRLRLTADGNLKVCLFGVRELSLRDAVRAGAADADLDALVRLALRNKKPAHAESRPYGEPAHDTDRRLARWGWWGSRGRRAAARGYCTLTHLDAEGRARMVDVGEREATRRAAAAECAVVVGARLLRLLRDARLPKGDALTVAEVAGVLAAKRTADLIPMCHPLPLECVRVEVRLPRGECAAGGAVAVRCEARATARTGAEMEALVGCAVAALALYDMCKSVDREITITQLRVVHKEGGRRDAAAAPLPPPPLRAPDASPLRVSETYAPTDLAHF
ncbi:hypothetical protein K1T71_001549 [Dendrolimus kikuchii]|uniref:Uncharacterized protein n=1 Tax=Dendrolimus kikuchii TaxID=765133 RepID=A0ACC1DHY1_9NEOP|nr:hypothetical protein K1T71_001549 [Dendrolimus kikuchii]